LNPGVDDLADPQPTESIPEQRVGVVGARFG
jgi:hypothetical protein